jgi:TonB family protein
MKIKKILCVAFFASLATAVLAQQAANPRPRKLRVSEGVMSESAIHKVAPEYPEAAKIQGIAGPVVLGLEIDTAGHVVEATVISGDPLLTESAIKAAEQWQFEPYQLDGQPVAVETRATVYVGPAQPQPPRKLRVSQGVMENNLVTQIDPIYPAKAREYRIQGHVIFRATIDREGNVSDLKTISGHPLLVEAAMEAVRQWKYKPLTLNNEPVEVETTIQVQFRL